MEERANTTGATRLLWSLVLGLGLALGLLWALMPGPAVEAQAVNPGFTVDLFHGRVWGKVGPGELVTVTGPGSVYGAARADATGFFWTPLWDSTAGTEVAINDGDTFNFYVDGALDATITARDVTGQVDVLNDRVTGNIPGVSAGTAVTVTLKDWSGGEPEPGAPQATVTTDGSGNFTADFSGSVNISPMYWATVDYAVGSAVRDHLSSAGVFLVDSYQTVEGYAQPGQTVTATIYAGTSSVDEVVSGTADKIRGNYVLQPSVASLDPGDLVEVDLGGGTVISTIVASLSLHVDADADVVTGTAPAGESVRVFFWRWEGDENHYYEVNTTASGGGLYTADFSSQVDLPRSAWVNAAVSDVEGDETGLWGGDTFIGADLTKDNAWARVDAGGVPVTATLYTGTNTYTWNGTSYTQYHYVGGIWFDDGTGNPVDIQAGHVITFASPTWSDSMVAANVTLDYDVEDDRVTGNAPAGHGEVHAGQWESWRYPINGQAVQTVTLASPFNVTFADFDLRYGGWVDFYHFNNDGYETFVSYPLPYVLVEMPHGVGGNVFVPNEATTATLYYSDGVTVKAQDTIDRDDDPIRFWLDSWGRERFEVGDWVTVTGESGWEAGVQVVGLTVAADEATDRMWGRGPVGLLYAHWDDWPGLDGRDDFVPTDGSGNYVIDWSAYGVDVLTGHNMRTYYIAPDGNQVSQNILKPSVGVHKRSEGQPAVGGNFAYWIQYSSHGRADATDVVLTDTLPANTTYVTDSSGFPTHVNGNVITWSLGTVPANSNAQFLLVAAVGSGASGTLQNQVEIYAPGDDYPFDNSDTSDDDVQTADVNLRVEKWGHHSEPAPGYDFTYHIEYRNDGGTGSGIVTLTDTMPTSTTFVSHYSPDPLWNLVGVVGNRVVFTRPVIPGWYGDWLRLTLHLSDTVSEGTDLDNVIEIGTTNETGGLDNNVYTHTMQARSPFLNVGVDKEFGAGITAPGHDVTYWIHYRNHSNTPAHGVLITDTLPTGMTFVTSSLNVQQNGVWQDIPFPPTSTTSSQVVWGLGTLNPAEDSETRGSIRLVLRIAPSVAAGTVLTNEVEIAPTVAGVYTDDDDADDRDQVAITVQDAGPNLMIRKRGRWQGGPPWQIEYDFEFLNIGTTSLQGLTVTDTYPLSTTLDSADLWWGGTITFTHNAANRQAIWQMDETLGLGDSVGGRLRVDVDPAIERGRLLTNVIEITVPPGDVNPQDNTCTDVRTTGPDLYVVKTGPSLWDELGEVLTFTLRYGNQAERWEDSTDWGGTVTVTDTLPAGMAYVTSTQRYCGGPQCPYITPDIVGDQLVFDVGPQGENWWNEIYLAVQVTGTAQYGDVFVNDAVIASSNPASDVEPYYGNNSDAATVNPSCILLSSVSFTYAPLEPVIRSPVVFTATHLPPGATTPITYAWNFGDGSTGSGATPSHTYTVSGTKRVRLTAYNRCTPAGVSATPVDIEVGPLSIFLPLVMRSS
jgi:uncharacterized repeat protein (TIGR01451 family)